MSLPRIFLVASLFAMAAARADDVPPEMRLEALPQHAPEPGDNPGTPEKISLGRLLFFDPVLSATKTVACATCHSPAFGWGDGRTVPLGIGGAGVGPDRKLGGNSSFAPLTRH